MIWLFFSVLIPIVLSLLKLRSICQQNAQRVVPEENCDIKKSPHEENLSLEQDCNANVNDDTARSESVHSIKDNTNQRVFCEKIHSFNEKDKIGTAFFKESENLSGNSTAFKSLIDSKSESVSSKNIVRSSTESTLPQKSLEIEDEVFSSVVGKQNPAVLVPLEKNNTALVEDFTARSFKLETICEERELTSHFNSCFNDGSNAQPAQNFGQFPMSQLDTSKQAISNIGPLNAHLASCHMDCIDKKKEVDSSTHHQFMEHSISEKGLSHLILTPDTEDAGEMSRLLLVRGEEAEPLMLPSDISCSPHMNVSPPFDMELPSHHHSLSDLKSPDFDPDVPRFDGMPVKSLNKSDDVVLYVHETAYTAKANTSEDTEKSEFPEKRSTHELGVPYLSPSTENCGQKLKFSHVKSAMASDNDLLTCSSLCDELMTEDKGSSLQPVSSCTTASGADQLREPTSDQNATATSSHDSDNEWEDDSTIDMDTRPLEARDPIKTRQLKDQANELFARKEYPQALELYLESLSYCRDNEDAEIMAVLHSNASACYLNAKNYADALVEAESAIALNPNYAKAHLRRFRAHVATEKYTQAKSDLEEAMKQDEALKTSFKLEYEKISSLAAEQFEKEKAELLDKLKGAGNWLLNKVGLSLDNFQVQQNPEGSYNITFQQNAAK